MNVVKRPSVAYIECPQCKRPIAVAPVFRIFNNNRYEAWAKFWFEKGETGRRLCKIIYEHKEYAPSTGATKITNYEVDGWTWSQYEDEKGIITLDELASSL